MCTYDEIRYRKWLRCGDGSHPDDFHPASLGVLNREHAAHLRHQIEQEDTYWSVLLDTMDYEIRSRERREKFYGASSD